MKFYRFLIPMMAAVLPMTAFSGAHDSAGAAPTCMDLEFAPDILAVLPEANAACREVVMKGGQPYARFTAEIRKNLMGSRNQMGKITARFKRADGSWTSNYTFSPDPSARIKIGGRSYRWSELGNGQQLDLYLPPDRFAVAVHDDPELDFVETEVVIMTVVVERAPREELPTTASIVPLIGALGALFVALGAGIGFVRRRLG